MRRGVVVCCGVLLIASSARAAGFEKAVTWSGRYAGLANAATGLVDGSQSLFFNPAGLALGEGELFGLNDGRRFDVSLNLSPTFSRFTGPTVAYAQDDSEIGFSPIFAAFASWRPFAGLGVGAAAGAYVSAGTNAKFDDVSFRSVNPNFDTLAPTLESHVEVLEASLGAAYEIVDGLRIGGAWRASIVRANLSSALPVPAPAGAPAGTPPVALVAVSLDDLSATDFTGFRVGLQYAPRGSWAGVGLSWRTPVNFRAEGDLTGSIEGGVGPNGPSAALPGGEAAVSSQLPSQISLGGWVALWERTVRVAAEYAFTHYRVIRAIDIDAAVQTPAGAIPVPDLRVDWDNQHVGRFGVEVVPVERTALRLGYAIVSQVTNSARARATLASPGLGHSVNLGGGYAWGNGFRADLALEYAFAGGTGTNEFGIPGEFHSRGVAAHLGCSYAF